MSIQEAVHGLDNPAWYALTTHQADIAIGTELAKRYPADIAPFVALANDSEAAFADLAQIVTPGERLVLRGFELPPEVPGWVLQDRKKIVQMVSEQPLAEIEGIESILTLTEADVPDMLRLVDEAKPGPFLARTFRLGTYIGIRIEGKLIAMAGERMYLTGYREISAVCTHPNHRGKGYASRLMIRLMAQERAQGDMPILHVLPENVGAQRVYESLGFRKSRELPYVALSRP